MNSREKRIAVQSGRQKENTPTPEPQVIVEPWMRTATREMLLAEAVTQEGISMGERTMVIARAYAPERARLQAQLEVADRLADIASKGVISSMLHRWAEKVDKAARAYLEARGEKKS